MKTYLGDAVYVDIGAYGITLTTEDGISATNTIYLEPEVIAAERQRQDARWGIQNHDDHKWNTILFEEKGEVSKAILEHDGPGVLKELSHVAAVAVAWIEAIGRRAAEGGL